MKRTLSILAAAVGFASAAHASYSVNLSTLNTGTMLTHDTVVSGTLNGSSQPYLITIADGATVTFRNVTINGSNSANCKWAGITCEGDATIILEGENTVKGFYREFPGIFVPQNHTLTIEGPGSLTASSNNDNNNRQGAGIGAAYGVRCGHIVINGGRITAEGGGGGAGIGGAYNAWNGSITINGGTVVATASGGSGAAGIGGGYYHGFSSTISIGAGIDSVVATGDPDCPYPIGAGAKAQNNYSTTVIVADTLEDTTVGNTRTIKARKVDLSEVTSDTRILDATTVFGTLDGSTQPYRISIADGATVTISNAMVNGENDDSYQWAGITCEGDATIILVGSSILCGFYEDYPGISVLPGKTLTLRGSGSLDASSNGWGSGIGGGYEQSCGNIVIEDGYIDATGGRNAAGIGCGQNASCGDITISGGYVEASSEYGSAPGIGGGGGNNSSCGDIAITGGGVEAWGHGDAAAIGTGYGTCGDITIGPGIETVAATPGEYCDIAIGACPVGTCGAVTVDPTLFSTRQLSTLYIQHWETRDLSEIASDTLIGEGTVLTGTLSGQYKLTIDDNATVTLRDAVILGTPGEDDDFDVTWAGLTCDGNVTIILEGTNVVRGFNSRYPGIFIEEGYTLTIKGGGSLDASSNGKGCGIGGGQEIDCGNIVIDGGIITAAGGDRSAAIGGGGTYDSPTRCGSIVVGPNALRIAATPGESCYTAIGAGLKGRCGPVLIDSGMEDVTSGTTRTLTRKNVNLAAIGGDITLVDGATATGKLAGPYKVSIADGATVTIKDVDINGDWKFTDTFCAGLTCLGDATIVLEGANTVRGLFSQCAGVTVAPGSTLTIRGSGSLAAYGGFEGAGIGGGYLRSCGNIVIESGTITAVGGYYAAGIGGAYRCDCGSISIRGGTVIATGGSYGPGIGSGYGNVSVPSSCGGVTISGGTVTATGGYCASGIGTGESQSICESVGIGEGVVCVTAVKGDSSPYSVGPGKYGTIGIWGVTVGGEYGEIEESPFVYTGRGVDLSGQTGSYTARDRDIIVGATTNVTVTIPAGTTVTVNGMTFSGGEGGTAAISAPAFGTDGDAATTKFVQGPDGKWTLTTFAEFANDALGRNVADGQIKVYAADTVKGLDSAAPLAGGVTVKEKKNAVKVTLEVVPPSGPAQFFKVKFGE